MAKRNKKQAKMTTEVKEVMPGNVAPTTEREIINADAMAEAITTTGSDYQQYIRNLFKDKLKK